MILEAEARCRLHGVNDRVDARERNVLSRQAGEKRAIKQSSVCHKLAADDAFLRLDAVALHSDDGNTRRLAARACGGWYLHQRQATVAQSED